MKRVIIKQIKNLGGLQICLFLHFKLESKVFKLFKNVIQGLKTKLLKLKKDKLKIFLLCGPHLQARGLHSFQKNDVLAGRSLPTPFAD